MNLSNFLNNLSKEEIQELNNKELKENEKLYNYYLDAFKKDCCALCGNKINYFNEFEPCFHWFTLPDGIKKKHFRDYLKYPIGYHNLESYFRWMSSFIVKLQNINDLSDEMTESKLREVTIKFKNIEWSLNYGHTDVEGHKDSKNASFPHFHIQILRDGQIFIKFNDFHIPFSNYDLDILKLKKENGDKIDFRFDKAEGMSLLENPDYLKAIEKEMTVSNNESNATFSTTTMIQMPEGETMSGENIDKIFKESKKTGIPARKLFEDDYPQSKIITEIKAGKGVPLLKKRNKRNKKK